MPTDDLGFALDLREPARIVSLVPSLTVRENVMVGALFGTPGTNLRHAQARADHLGRTTQVWSATVFAGNGKPLAVFRCTQMILS